MKAYVIAEDTHIVYYWCDEAVVTHLKSLRNNQDHDQSESSFDSYIQMYFLPVFLSHQMLKSQLNEACSSVSSDDQDTVVVFQDYQEFVYIALENSCSGGKEKLSRELSFLRNTISFLFGPCGHSELKTTQVTTKEKAWHSVTTILQQYTSLCEVENSFLLEGVERIRVNEDVNKVCNTVIQKSMKSFDSLSNLHNVQYGLVFVGAKILTLHASSRARYNLSTQNILQIITLSSLGSAQPDSEHEVRSESDIESFEIQSNIGSDLPFIPSTDEEEDVFPPHETKDSTSDPGPLSSTGSRSQSETELGSSLRSQYSEGSQVTSASNNSITMVNNHFDVHGKENASFHIKNTCIPVYLTTPEHPCLPHLLYCIPLSNQVNLVFIFKVPHSEVSDMVCGMLDLLRKLKFSDRKLEVIGGQTTVNNLEKCSKLLVQKTRELKGKSRSRLKRLTSSWNSNGQRNLNMFVNTGDGEYTKLLETCVRDTKEQLRRFFQSLFPSYLTSDASQWHTADLCKIYKFAKAKLTDYTEYLHVKCTRNITMSPYLATYPGLVHFSLILRTREQTGSTSYVGSLFQDELFSPSMVEVTTNEGNDNLYMELRKQFKEGIYKSEANLSDHGTLCTQLEAGDFMFTSKICFSNINRHKSTFKVSIDSDLLTGANEPCSVFSGPFYKNFLSKGLDPVPASFTVYHLVTIHFSLVPKDVVAKQREQLFHNVIEGLNSGI